MCLVMVIPIMGFGKKIGDTDMEFIGIWLVVHKKRNSGYTVFKSFKLNQK